MLVVASKRMIAAVSILTLLTSAVFAAEFNISAMNASVDVKPPPLSSIVQTEFSSNNFTYQGVAIGGWLVLEPYITPSLFLAFNATEGTNETDIPVDEYHYCKQLGREEAGKRLQQHWSTFYNESDFAKIASYGLNMVRIPVGYWAFAQLEDDPYVEGAEDYLDLAIGWAHNNGLKVWVDLHGVPGSQNGFDNSGYRDIGYPGWFNATENLQLTMDVLHHIYAKYGDGSNSTYAETVLGIEVVNEPFSPGLNMLVLTEYYNEAYVSARTLQLINNTIVFHDAFEGMGYWNDFRNSTAHAPIPQHGQSHPDSGHGNSNASDPVYDNYNILIDHHHYEVFTSDQLLENITEHINGIKGYASWIYQQENSSHPSVVGEWLAALTDCAPWINGVGLGSRYEGQAPYDNLPIGLCSNINNWAEWNATEKENTRKFIEIQLDQYNNYTMGWIFWCFKTETTIEWDFQRLVEFGLMPQPLSNRTYIINGTDITTLPKKKSSATSVASPIWTTFIIGLLITFIV